MATAKASKGLVALFKQGWNEIPEVMASSGLALIGLASVCRTLYISYTYGEPYKQYKSEYVIMRPEDPRVKLIPKTT